MVNDKSIKEQVKEIQTDCNSYLDYVNGLNECAYSDRMIEGIIEKCNTLSLLHKSNKSELINERNFKGKYEYNLLYFWNDSDDLYVNYVITNTDTKEKANVVNYYNISDIGVENYDLATDEEIKDNLYKLIRENSGHEFELIKVSELNSLLKYVYKSVCESDSNMCHISDDDWNDLVEDGKFTEKDFEKLKEDIDKYEIDNLLSLNENGYKICGYGCLQTVFNDDSVDRSDELER